jgi:hypothetical protein
VCGFLKEFVLCDTKICVVSIWSITHLIQINWVDSLWMKPYGKELLWVKRETTQKRNQHHSTPKIIYNLTVLLGITLLISLSGLIDNSMITC